ncbi:hypothetical protein GHK48_33280 [Sinorhizobium fredii]|uniref:Uncharacterized protein n=1 Tax=Rhizobium fredii TaxID=380 RepID=A0A844AL46_RHIFR|nr:hypothetical protein [Sinorhizobium fredii]MQX12957.1 hypothetical protein [Sinorhizobium fredii]UTY48447.1 hypothetical protein EPK84_17525 [Sinorhizobium fredii]
MATPQRTGEASARQIERLITKAGARSQWLTSLCAHILSPEFHTQPAVGANAALQRRAPYQARKGRYSSLNCRMSLS